WPISTPSPGRRAKAPPREARCASWGYFSPGLNLSRANPTHAIPGRALPQAYSSGDFLSGFRPVGEKGFEPLVRERMAYHGTQDRRRHGGDIGADQRRLLHMVDGADRGRENFGTEIVIVINGADLADQFHAI